MRFQVFYRAAAYSTVMTSSNEIEAVFDAAIDQVQRIVVTPEGRSVIEQLGQLELRLRAERKKAVEQGTVSADWVQRTIRWVVEWMPESDLTVIAALGRIARLAPRASHYPH